LVFFSTLILFLTSVSWLSNDFLELLDPENESLKSLNSTGNYLPVDTRQHSKNLEHSDIVSFDITHFVFEAVATFLYNILWYRLMARFVGWWVRGNGRLWLDGVPL